MKYLYFSFLLLWSIVLLTVVIIQTVKLCKDTETVIIISDLFVIVFYLGLLAQFIAVGVQVIGG
jgi:hypothetical protein